MEGKLFTKKVCKTVCAFLIAVGVFSVMAGEAKGPQMVLKERVFDFGQVKEGELLVHDFVVLNEGDETLEIRDVKPG
jgi:hypothetical protein